MTQVILPKGHAFSTEAPTKSEGDAGRFKSSAYAHVPDPIKPGTWKLRLFKNPDDEMPDPGIVGQAAAALGPGFRGNPVKLAPAAKAKAKAKVRAAWTKANPDKDPNDMPAQLKAAESTQDVVARSIQFHEAGIPSAELRAWVEAEFAEVKRSAGDKPAAALAELPPCPDDCDECDDASDCPTCDECDNDPFNTKATEASERADFERMLGAALLVQADEPGASDVHLDSASTGIRAPLAPTGQVAKLKKRLPGATFLSKLREHLKGKVSDADYQDAVVKARAHAGGVAPHQPVAPAAYAEFSFLPYGAVPGDWDAGIEAANPGDPDEDWEEGPQLEKSDARVGYRASDKPGEACGLCKFFDADDLSCRIVEGQILPTMGCNLFTPDVVGAVQGSERRHELADFMQDGDRLFLELPHAFSEPPEWMPLLPKPGVFQHPEYGPIVITPERNRRFMDNFKAGVYQEHIPIDIEHDGKMSGAMGYMRDMRQNPDGSIDVKPEWTAVGVQGLREDRFRYVSPEFHRSWEKPFTGVKYEDVIIGAALTTRPYFKDQELRSLVASERGLYIGPATAPATQPQRGNPVPNPTVTQPTPSAPIVLGEVHMVDGNAVIVPAGASAPPAPATGTPPTAFSEQAFREVQQQLAESRAQLAQMAEHTRRQRFAEMVQGRGGADDGRHWIGSPEHNVQMLEFLANQFGEESPEFKAHLAEERAKAEQVRTSGLFGEIGAAGSAFAADTAAAKIQAFAEEIRAKSPGLSRAKAMVQASREHPELYAEHDRKRPSRRMGGMN